MTDLHHFTSIRFHRFKGFKNYSVALREFNILVGPNNCGKSTIIGAFRILEEAMRKARSRNPELIAGPDGDTFGYSVDLSGIPVATENVFYDYDGSDPATISFRLSNDNKLLIIFPEVGSCHLICYPKGKPIRSTIGFRNAYNAPIGFVPILGPVEHNEQLYNQEAARLALLTHRAARNFRNIWYHYKEDFEDFRTLVNSTWPGMDIEKPEVDYTHSPTRLHMFCPEERIPREIFWAGFGFQVWCQMLTYIIRGRSSSLFLIDEPDIYLHSDLQRQLLGILRTLGPDILIATHSTEIITEAETDDLLIVNKQSNSAKRIRHPGELQKVFHVLGSNMNPILTQLAKTKRALFVEGKDFQVLSRFAKKLGKTQVANRGDFAVVPVEGFKPSKVKDFFEGIRATLDCPIYSAVVFDRDYRSETECCEIQAELEQICFFVRIHGRKEIENFLLHPAALSSAIVARLANRKRQTGEKREFEEDITVILDSITSPMKNKVLAQYLERRKSYEKARDPRVSDETIAERLLTEYDRSWNDLLQRLCMVPGKETLAALNLYLQKNYRISVTSRLVVDSFSVEEIDPEMTKLIGLIDDFRQYT
ncbi:MAG: AAA family ATPase, partial [Planctomycetota bacterium]|nr:AAA family ATPase [Planctomycetota bacterium]